MVNGTMKAFAGMPPKSERSHKNANLNNDLKAVEMAIDNASATSTANT
jgi:hypothetical protein